MTAASLIVANVLEARLGRVFTVMGLALSCAGCIEVYRYDLVPLMLDNVVASDGMAWICKADRELVILRSAQVAGDQVCGWTSEMPERQACVSLASIDRIVLRRVEVASAFKTLQRPSCEPAAGG